MLFRSGTKEKEREREDIKDENTPSYSLTSNPRNLIIIGMVSTDRTLQPAFTAPHQFNFSNSNTISGSGSVEMRRSSKEDRESREAVKLQEMNAKAEAYHRKVAINKQRAEALSAGILSVSLSVYVCERERDSLCVSICPCMCVR